MQFKQIAIIVASCVALSNAVAIPDPAAVDQGISPEIAAPANLLARSLNQQIKHVRKLKARADQAEELADQLKTREAEDAAIAARDEHVETANLVRRALYYGQGYRQNQGAYDNFDGLRFDALGLLDFELGSSRRGYYNNVDAYNNGFYSPRRFRDTCWNC